VRPVTADAAEIEAVERRALEQATQGLHDRHPSVR
jgi:hypothetical protein